MASDGFILSVDPESEIKFTGPFGESKKTELKLKNSGEAGLAYKVKCTDNSLFRIRPVVGIIPPGEEKEVEITLTVKDGKAPVGRAHHFLVTHTESGEETKNARSVWEKLVAAGGKGPEKRLAVVFQEEAAPAAPVEGEAAAPAEGGAPAGEEEKKE